MELYFNEKGKVEVKDIDKNSQVTDFIKAIDNLLDENPLYCIDCNDNCCSRDWNIELDIVFFNRLYQGAIKGIKGKSGRRIDDLKKNQSNKQKKWIDTLIDINALNRPVFNSSPCIFLKENGLCKIYAKRPLICRGYICYEESDNYKLVRDIILDSLNLILLIKLISFKENQSMEEIASNKFRVENIDLLPFHKSDYNISIYNLVKGLKSVLGHYRFKKIQSLFS